MKRDLLLEKTLRVLAPLLLGLSLVVFWRGHHLPGGGFIGGLLAAIALALGRLTGNPESENKRGPSIEVWLAIGLALALSAGLMGAFAGESFFKGLWLPSLYLPIIGKVHLGTPLLFDLGVFITVTAFALKTTLDFMELERWNGS